MTIKLSVDNVVEHWETIKFCVLKVNDIKEENREKYCINLLVKLLSGNCQCWFILSDDRRIINVTITRILGDIGTIPYLLIDCSYGFEGASEQQKDNYIDVIMKYAKSKECEKVLAYTSNPMAANALRKVGMDEAFKVHSREVL